MSQPRKRRQKHCYTLENMISNSYWFKLGWHNKGQSNMIDKINKNMRGSMNATPTRHRNKNQSQGAQEDPKQKTEQGARQSTDRHITKMIHRKK
jgi:hypothetical protein